MNPEDFIKEYQEVIKECDELIDICKDHEKKVGFDNEVFQLRNETEKRLLDAIEWIHHIRAYESK